MINRALLNLSENRLLSTCTTNLRRIHVSRQQGNVKWLTPTETHMPTPTTPKNYKAANKACVQERGQLQKTIISIAIDCNKSNINFISFHYKTILLCAYVASGFFKT